MQRRPDNLDLITRFKVFVHGGKQAFAVNEDACTSCLKCIEACPENAISMQE